ncbi:nuclear transport factor 2 family protein [Streptomyces sp. NPDC101149]|uniref:nuclear transport factor 2 family protein n=1 Tax=Streptomyces sp. NPDC101149 TaxID=3366113 RepID=UPI0038292861
MSDDLKKLAYRNLLDVFNERNSEDRSRAIREIYDESVVFYDPEEAVVGWDSLNDKAQAILNDAPGFLFRPEGEVRISHNLAYLAWSFGPRDGDPVITGIDISIVENGRITALYTMLNVTVETP